MPRDMFRDVVKRSAELGSRKWYSVPVSITVHTLTIAAIIIIPLMAAGILPKPPAIIAFVVPRPTPAPPLLPRPPRLSQSAAQNPKPRVDIHPAAPGEAPSDIKPGTQPPHVDSGVADVGGVEPGVFERVSIGIGDGSIETPPPSRPLPPPVSIAPVRVGGQIKPPIKIKDVRPIYPSIAQSARVQGIVIIEAKIGEDGTVQEAKVLRSIPLLDQAALDAVKQWLFTPTRLNEVPVPVVMTVAVNFTLQ